MLQPQVYHDFSNVGFAGRGRVFSGFPKKGEHIRVVLAARAVHRFDVRAGELISVMSPQSLQQLRLAVFDRSGRQDAGLLGLENGLPMAADSCDSARLLGWIAGQGGDHAVPLTPADVSVDELLVLKARADCTVWAMRPLAATNLVSAATLGPLEVAHQPAPGSNRTPLPPYLGEVRDEFTVDRGTAKSYELRAGEVVQIIDIEGQQCSDFMALRRSKLDMGLEFEIDSTATRSMVRGTYPGPGMLDKFYDRELRPMMRVIQDTCGRHDAFGMACTSRGYEERGFPGHVNCSDNISGALEPYGIAYRPAWPAINFFWNTWVDAHSHQLQTEESHSRPGDYIALRALDDMVCVTTACPDDIDPINGWNPTDVHVRIYKPDAPIHRAVAYREKEDAPMAISQESPFHTATSKLTTQFTAGRDLWLPVSYPSVGTIGEYWACRNKATLQDMSSLLKYDIIGPDAESLLQYAMTRDVAKLAVWRGTYALICDETGAVIDDGTLFRMADDLFRWCCGTEESARVLQGLAAKLGLQARIHGHGSGLPNLALQGPKSREVLRKLVFTQPTMPSLENLRWFGATVARVGDRDGIPFMLTRTGYTGELGYEMFCAASDASALWDAVMEAGEEFGLEPMGGAALETIRIEAGLAAANAEFAPGTDAYEAGLGFAVNLGKSDFVGKGALMRNSREPRRVQRGMKLNSNDVPRHGSHVFAGERAVGVVTSATRSPMFECAIAMVRLSVEHAQVGGVLEIGQMDGHMKRLPGTVCEVPFYDPKRERARA